MGIDIENVVMDSIQCHGGISVLLTAYENSFPERDANPREIILHIMGRGSNSYVPLTVNETVRLRNMLNSVIAWQCEGSNPPIGPTIEPDEEDAYRGQP